MAGFSKRQERPPAQLEDDIDMNNHDSFRQSTSEPSGHSFFEGARNTIVRGGQFNNVGGSVYQSAQPQTGPVPSVQRPQQQPLKTSFFKNSSGTQIDGGSFTAVDHDFYLHGSPPSGPFQQNGNNVGAYNQAPTAFPSPIPSIEISQVDAESILIPHGPSINPSQSSVGETSINPPTSLRPEAAVGPPFKGSLIDNADRVIFSIQRPLKSDALYKIVQVEIRYGLDRDRDLPYSILAFRLETGDDDKKCIAVKLKGEFIKSSLYQDVNVKSILCVPEDTQAELTKVPTQFTSMNTSQLMGGMTNAMPTFQATFSHMKSVQTTLAVAGQTSQSRFDDSKGTFDIILGVDRSLEKRLSVVNPVHCAVLLRLKENRQPMKLKLTLEVTYKRKYMLKTGFLDKIFEADYSGREIYDIVKVKQT